MGSGADGTGGNTTTYGWDGRNNALSQKLPLGATASVTAYQTIAGTDLPNDFTTADGRKDTFEYDTNGNTMSVTTSGTAGGTREYSYNKDTPTCGGFEGQRCTAKDANGKVTSFEYDTKGNLKKVTPPAPLGTTIYTYDYDSQDRLRYALEADSGVRKASWLYCWDKAGNLTSQDGSKNACPTYTYDDASELTGRNGSTTGWSYDKLGNETAGASTPPARTKPGRTTASSPGSRRGARATTWPTQARTTQSARSWVRPGSTTPHWAWPPRRRTAWTPDSSANRRAP
ncbi:hypothetical protein RM641_07110 [Streptomyces sp. DSM 41921]|uniref:RHS repeat protein n=1 Tax=Streptomyces dubilierae TaxID=3075533 RepID=A0ABU2P4Y0_9ACTN|nr:hypothetical protein [Streptomyces sp. DSM 41921]MDT0387190.1 hypothetical protein [Streptomyces sp. DSM 41921]